MNVVSNIASCLHEECPAETNTSTALSHTLCSICWLAIVHNFMKKYQIFRAITKIQNIAKNRLTAKIYGFSDY